MPHVYIGRWAWVAPVGGPDPQEEYWAAPYPAVGGVDLRTAAQAGAAGGPGGLGLFILPTKPVDATLLYLGDNLDGSISNPVRRNLEDRLGLVRNSITSNVVRTLLWQMMNALADPTGLLRWKPITPTAAGVMELHLGGFSLAYAELYSHVRYPQVMEVVKADWRRLRIECGTAQARLDAAGLSWERAQARIAGLKAMKTRDPEVVRSPQWQRLVEVCALPEPVLYRRMLTALSEKYRMTPREMLDLWGEAQVEPLPHSTTITESFNVANQDALGPDLSWTEMDASDWDVVSNAAELITNATTNNSPARADTDLATDDHYAEATLLAQAGAGTRNGGVIARKDSTTTLTYYHFDVLPQASNAWRTFRRSTGTFTAIGVDTAVSWVSGDVIKGQADGSSIQRFKNGVSQDTVTDSIITGNLRSGITARTAGWRLDVFTGADVAAAAALNLERIERHTLRGVMRGVLRGVA